MSSLRRCIVAAAVFVLAASVSADNWPQFRGPTGQGHTKDTDLPLKWSPTENVKWKVKLPDQGNSTPVVWGNKVFITQASEKSWPPKPTSGGPAVAKKRSLMCLDRANGKTLWEKTVIHEEAEVTHGTNPFCSASPATDGERVVVSHGTPGLFCYDLDGKELWQRTDLGKQEHIWGNASSPVIHGDLVLFVVGPGENTALYAFDKKDGKDVWKVTEPGGKSGLKKGEGWIGSWSTPIVVTVGDHEELIMTWPGVVKAYDPKKGTELWSCQGLEKDKGSDRLVYTSPVATDQVVVAAAGFGGPALAVKPGGKGDVTETHRLWRHASAPQRIGSGVIIGEHFYLVNEPGTFICVEWKTGKTLFTERVGSAWGSLVHAGDRFYITDRQGTTHVLAAKPKFEELAANALKEHTDASIAVADKELFIRTHQNLWCIGKSD